MGLLKFIVILFCVFYLVKIILRLLIPILMRNFAAKLQDRFQNQFSQYNQDISDQQEGQVTIEKKNKSASKRSESLGEYVDFEEVDG